MQQSKSRCKAENGRDQCKLYVLVSKAVTAGDGRRVGAREEQEMQCDWSTVQQKDLRRDILDGVWHRRETAQSPRSTLLRRKNTASTHAMELCLLSRKKNQNLH